MSSSDALVESTKTKFAEFLKNSKSKSESGTEVVTYLIYGDGSLSNVSTKNAFSNAHGCNVENFVLFFYGQRAKLIISKFYFNKKQ